MFFNSGLGYTLDVTIWLMKIGSVVFIVLTLFFVYNYLFNGEWKEITDERLAVFSDSQGNKKFFSSKDEILEYLGRYNSSEEIEIRKLDTNGDKLQVITSGCKSDCGDDSVGDTRHRYTVTNENTRWFVEKYEKQWSCLRTNFTLKRLLNRYGVEFCS